MFAPYAGVLQRNSDTIVFSQGKGPPRHAGRASDAVAAQITQLPLSHFFKKLVFAAPDNGLPSLLTAESSQHFLIELIFAAPANGLPSLLTALVAQDCAAADPTAKAEMMRASARRFMRPSPWLGVAILPRL
jgi:hypothetical protein